MVSAPKTHPLRAVLILILDNRVVFRSGIPGIDFQTDAGRVVNLKVASCILGTCDVDCYFVNINARISNSRHDFVGLAVGLPLTLVVHWSMWTEH